MSNHRFDWKWYLKDLNPDKDINVLTTFSCGGGSSMGYKRAGFHVIGNVEIDPKINAMYVKNHHPKYNFNMDLRKFNEKEDLPEELYHLDILDGSPPCFAAGTKVKTKQGYKAIENILPGEMVLTHKGRYRKVIDTMSHMADNCYEVKIQGVMPIVATGNHPFFVRTMVRDKDGKRCFSSPEWVPVESLVIEKGNDGATKKQSYVGIPVNNESKIPLRKQQHFIYDNGYIWLPFRRKKPIEGQAMVYNLSVDEDESYTVSNIAVHNCTTFSSAGQREKTWGKLKKFREGQAAQTLDDLFFVFLDTVEKLKPKIVCAENVPGLLHGNAKGYVNLIIKKFRELGYEVQIFSLNAARMDVPSARHRIFFVANRMGYPKLKLDFHYDAIPFGDVKAEHGRGINEDSVMAQLAKKARRGDRSLEDAYYRMTGKKGKYFTTYIVADGVVAPAITSGGETWRMCDRTPFTDEDYRNAQSFPQDYDFCCNEPKYVCGMSVPPNMMANIATEIYDQWLSK